MGPLDGPLPERGSRVAAAPAAATFASSRPSESAPEGTWSRYGFINAFNPMTKGMTRRIGIDTGITLLMAENLRSEFVWNTFMKNANVSRSLDRAGFGPY
jgi:hypothetical protein